MDGIPTLDKLAAQFQLVRKTIVETLEWATPAERASLEPVLAEMEKQFAAVSRTYPAALADLDRERDSILERTKKAQARLAEVLAQIEEAQKGPPKAAPAAPKPAVDLGLGLKLRADILRQFGKPAEGLKTPRAGSVAEMMSEEFQSLASAEVDVPPLPTWVAKMPAKASESFGDMAAASLSDFDDTDKEKKSARDSSGKIEGLPEDLWKD